MTDYLGFYITIWYALLFLIVARNWGHRHVNGSIVIFYVVSLTMIHGLGPLVYLFPWHISPKYQLTFIGFKYTVYGLAAFTLGHLITSFLGSSRIKRKLRSLSDVDIDQISRNRKAFASLPLAYVCFGTVLFLLMSTSIGSIATVRSLLSAGPVLITAAVCIAAVQAAYDGKLGRLRRWLMASLAFPVITAVTTGFMGLGAYMTLRIFLFVSKFARNKKMIIVIGVIFFYLGLSMFQVYMRDRGGLRDIVWGGGSVGESTSYFTRAIINFELFNPFNNQHLDNIDERLNQNVLVGASVKYLNTGDRFARGETLTNAILALIPRFIWKDKPISAGGNALVTQYTGIKFAKGTSVGVGHVMEFYINFGLAGILVGFFLLGIIITIVDQQAGYYLAVEDYPRFVIWFLPGLAVLNVEGTMFEVSATTAASLVVAYIASRFQSVVVKNVLWFIPLTVLLGGVYLASSVLPGAYPYMKKLLILVLGIIALRMLIIPFFRSRTAGQR